MRFDRKIFALFALILVLTCSCSNDKKQQPPAEPSTPIVDSSTSTFINLSKPSRLVKLENESVQMNAGLMLKEREYAVYVGDAKIAMSIVENPDTSNEAKDLAYELIDIS